MAADDRLAHLEPGGHVGREHQDPVGGEKRFGNGEAAVGAVIERALEPLRGGRVPGVAFELDDEPGEARHALGAHRIALVGHGARPHLLALERLEHFALVLQQPQVGGELGGGGGDPRQCRQHLRVLFARVRLAGDGEHAREPHFTPHQPVQLPDLVMIAVEQLEEARLCAGRPLDPAELQRLEAVQHLLGVEEKVLHPQRDPLADRRELRGLEVRVREAGHGAVAARSFAEGDEHRLQATEQQLQALAHQQQVGVVGDVGAGRAEVQVRSGRGRLVAEVVDVRHDVVAQAFLVLGGAIEVGVIEMGAQLRQRGRGNVQPQLALPFHQREPQPPPQSDAPALAPQRLHRGGGVARGERRDVTQTEALARAASLLQSFRN